MFFDRLGLDDQVQIYSSSTIQLVLLGHKFSLTIRIGSVTITWFLAYHSTADLLRDLKTSYWGSQWTTHIPALWKRTWRRV